MQVINIEIEEKTDYTLSITFRDDTTNLPVDLSGYTADLQVRGLFGSPYILLELTQASGIVLGGVTGNIDINFTPAMTDMSQQVAGWDRAAYDLVLTNLAGKKIKILKGFVTILRSATV